MKFNIIFKSLAFCALFIFACTTNNDKVNSTDIFNTHVKAINSKSAEKMAACISPTHLWITELGDTLEGNAKTLARWSQTFDSFHQYKLEVTAVFEKENEVMAHGFILCSVSDTATAMRIPAAWRMRVENDKVAEWQVFADSQKLSDVMGSITARDTNDLKVQGFGGVFFKATDPKALGAWYDAHLGTSFSGPSGTYFKWRDREFPNHIASTTFGIFNESSDYYAPSTKPFMINFRVNNLVALLAKLKAEGVQQVGEIDPYDYGKFAWIMDPEGNKIELWEPVDEVLDAYEKQQK